MPTMRSKIAGTGGNILKFMFSFIIAGVIMAFGESGTRAAQAIFERIVGITRGKGFTDLSTATIRRLPQASSVSPASRRFS